MTSPPIQGIRDRFFNGFFSNVLNVLIRKVGGVWVWESLRTGVVEESKNIFFTIWIVCIPIVNNICSIITLSLWSVCHMILILACDARKRNCWLTCCHHCPKFFHLYLAWKTRDAIKFATFVWHDGWLTGKKRWFDKLCTQTMFLYIYGISGLFLRDWSRNTKPTKSTSNRLGHLWLVCLWNYAGPVGRSAGRPSNRRQLVVSLLTTLGLDWFNNPTIHPPLPTITHAQAPTSSQSEWEKWVPWAKVALLTVFGVWINLTPRILPLMAA